MELKSSNYIYYSFLLIFFIISCIPIDYIGDTYPPTENVDIFYSEKEIRLKHNVFGHILGSDASFEDIQEQLKIEAMKRGADAILFTNIDFETSKKSKTNKISASLIKYID